MRFFVLHLKKEDCKDPNKQFEIQVLDDDGRAISFTHISYEQTTLVIDGDLIPVPVIDAAKRQKEGEGNYVNEAGEQVTPF